MNTFEKFKNFLYLLKKSSLRSLTPDMLQWLDDKTKILLRLVESTDLFPTPLTSFTHTYIKLSFFLPSLPYIIIIILIKKN